MLTTWLLHSFPLDVKLAFASFPRQMAFVKEEARFPAYIGGIGAGKTFSGACKVIARIGEKELGMVAAPTYSMLRDATQRTLLELLFSMGIKPKHNKSEKSLIFPSGHEILLRSLDNPETLRGPNLHYVWVDEGSLIDKETWQVVKGRVRIGKNPQAWVTMTPKGKNYAYQEWVVNSDEDHPLYRVRTDENPELPEGFVQGLGYEGTFFEQEIGGEFVTHEGLIYKNFDRLKQVWKRIVPDDWQYVIGVDAGVTNPSAILTIRHSGPEHVHLEREFYKRGMSHGELVDAVEEAYDETGRRATVYVDPSAAALILDLESRAINVEKANNKVQDGIRAVQTLINGDFSVDPSCFWFLTEIENYAWKANKDGTERDEPIKQNDHAMDAFRYGAMGVIDPVPDVMIW